MTHRKYHSPRSNKFLIYFLAPFEFFDQEMSRNWNFHPCVIPFWNQLVKWDPEIPILQRIFFQEFFSPQGGPLGLMRDIFHLFRPAGDPKSHFWKKSIYTFCFLYNSNKLYICFALIFRHVAKTGRPTPKTRFYTPVQKTCALLKLIIFQ